MGQSISVSIAECVATFQAYGSSTDSFSFAGDTFSNDGDLLGEISLQTELFERYLSADGTRDVSIQSAPRAGQREVSFLYGTDYERLLSWAQRFPQPFFNFDFYYKWYSEDGESARIQRHLRCGFKTLPMISVSRENGGVIRAQINFGDVFLVNPTTGQKI